MAAVAARKRSRDNEISVEQSGLLQRFFCASGFQRTSRSPNAADAVVVAAVLSPPQATKFKWRSASRKRLSAKGVKNYSDSTPGVADIRLTPDGTQFIVNGKKPGQTTLLLIKDDGTQVQYPITVSSKSIAGVEKDLQQLTEGMSGVHVRRVGSRFFLEGGVATDAELKRVQQIASLYPGQVESLVTVGGSGRRRSQAARAPRLLLRPIRSHGFNIRSASIGRRRSAAPRTTSSSFRTQLTYDFIGKGNDERPSVDRQSAAPRARHRHAARLGENHQAVDGHHLERPRGELSEAAASRTFSQPSVLRRLLSASSSERKSPFFRGSIRAQKSSR